MKRLASTNYSAGAFNVAMLILRVSFGVLMIPNGYNKLVHFADMKGKMMNFLGIGSATSLVLVIFAEFFCASLLVLGIFSRLVVIPLIITMLVAVFEAHKGLIFGEAGHAFMFLIGYFVILLVGPGKISVDGMIGK